MVEQDDKPDIMMDPCKCGHIRRIHDFQNDAKCVRCDCKAFEQASDEPTRPFSKAVTKHLGWLRSESSMESYLTLTNEFRAKMGKPPLDPDLVRREWRQIHGYKKGDLGGSARDEILEGIDSLESLEGYLEATNTFRAKCKEEPLDSEPIRARWQELHEESEQVVS